MKPHVTLIENARLVNPTSGALTTCDLLFRHAESGQKSRIEKIAPMIDRRTLSDYTLTALNAAGGVLMPPFADLAFTVREPGSMYKEDIASACRSAIAGGYRTLLAFFENDPRYAPTDALRYLWAHRREGACSLLLTAPLFDHEGRFWEDPTRFQEAGAVIFTDRFSPPRDEGELRRAMRYCAANGLLYHAFCHLPTLADGDVNSNIAALVGYRGISACAEEIAVARDLFLAEACGCKLHLSGLSSARSLALVRRAKADGMAVSCDVSPFHFYFDESAVIYHGNPAKLLPPLRTEHDRQAVIEAIADGTVDAIATHHTPNDKREVMNRRIEEAPFGAVSLQSAFCAAIEALLIPGHIHWQRLWELFVKNPTQILTQSLSLPDPLPIELCEGASADFSLIHPDRLFCISEESIKGRAKNTPFLGMELHGKLQRVFCDGVEQKINN